MVKHGKSMPGGRVLWWRRTSTRRELMRKPLDIYGNCEMPRIWGASIAKLNLESQIGSIVGIVGIVGSIVGSILPNLPRFSRFTGSHGRNFKWNLLVCSKVRRGGIGRLLDLRWAKRQDMKDTFEEIVTAKWKKSRDIYRLSLSLPPSLSLYIYTCR